MRLVSVLLALVFLFSPGTAHRARAEGAESNVSILALVAVVGIVVYAGWKIDQDDRDQQINSRGVVLRSDDPKHGLCVASPRAVAGELDAGLAYRLTF